MTFQEFLDKLQDIDAHAYDSQEALENSRVLRQELFKEAFKDRELWKKIRAHVTNQFQERVVNA